MEKENTQHAVAINVVRQSDGMDCLLLRIVNATSKEEALGKLLVSLEPEYGLIGSYKVVTIDPTKGFD